MPDFLKKATKAVDAVAHADETPIAALFVRPRSGDDTKTLGAPGGVLSKVGRLADDAIDAEATTRPADLFGRNTVLVLTAERLLLFGHGGFTGRVRGLLGEIPLGDIAAITLDTPEAGAATLDIEFADGDRVSLTPGSRRRRFVEAWDEVTQKA